MKAADRPMTIRDRSVTNPISALIVSHQNGNLNGLHFQVLAWVERRRSREKRPAIADIAPFVLDRAVAELVLEGLVKGVCVRRGSDQGAHWEATCLTAVGREALIRHRRAQPPQEPQPWGVRLFG